MGGTVLVNMLCMLTTHVDTMKPTYLPVDLLWKYREFKRDEIPSPKVSSFNTRDVDEVMEYVRANGLEPVELSIVGKKSTAHRWKITGSLQQEDLGIV